MPYIVRNLHTGLFIRKGFKRYKQKKVMILASKKWTGDINKARVYRSSGGAGRSFHSGLPSNYEIIKVDIVIRDLI